MAAGAIDLGVGFAVVLGVVGCAHWFLLANGIALGGLMIVGGFAYAVRLANATAILGPASPRLPGSVAMRRRAVKT